MYQDDTNFEQQLQQLKPGDRFAIMQTGPDGDIWVKSGYLVLEVSPVVRRVVGNLEQRFICTEEGEEQEEIPLMPADTSARVATFSFDELNEIIMFRRFPVTESF